jgi:hypothetical protein
MPQVGFEPTIPALELARTVHALDGVATVTGHLLFYLYVIRVYDRGFPFGNQEIILLHRNRLQVTNAGGRIPS